MDKRITVAKMFECLKELRPDDTVEVNAVGNMLVRDSQGESRGYIDLLEGDVEFWKKQNGR